MILFSKICADNKNYFNTKKGLKKRKKQKNWFVVGKEKVPEPVLLGWRAAVQFPDSKMGGKIRCDSR